MAVVDVARESVVYAPPSTLTCRSNRLSPSLELARVQWTATGTPAVGMVVAFRRTVGVVTLGAATVLGVELPPLEPPVEPPPVEPPVPPDDVAAPDA